MKPEQIEKIKAEFKKKWCSLDFIDKESIYSVERLWESVFDFIESKLAEAYEAGKADSIDTSKITRVEVIDEKGRSYVNWDAKNKVQLSFQDAMRTLKIFINRD